MLFAFGEPVLDALRKPDDEDGHRQPAEQNAERDEQRETGFRPPALFEDFERRIDDVHFEPGAADRSADAGGRVTAFPHQPTHEVDAARGRLRLRERGDFEGVGVCVDEAQAGVLAECVEILAEEVGE